MPLGIPDTRTFPWDVPLKHHLGQLMDLTQGGLISFAERPTIGVDGAVLGANHKGYTFVNTGSANIEQWDGSSWKVLIDSAKIVRAASIGFYINATTGSDNNTGLTIASPFKTIAKLLSELSTYNFLDCEINIYLGTGAYKDFKLPFNTAYLRVNLIGSSSAQVTMGAFAISNDQKVSISKLTLSQPNYASQISTFVLAVGNSILHIGPDIVLGDCGPNVIYFGCGSGSNIYLYPNSPIKVTANCYRLFSFGGSLIFRCYFADPWIKTPLPTPIPALTPSDTLCKIDFLGTLRTVVNTFFFLQGGSIFGDQYEGSCQISGNTSNALAYWAITNSNWTMNTVVGAVTGKGTIGFPSSATAGIIDSTSSAGGVRAI